MESWRDTIPEPTLSDFDDLTNLALNRAERLLGRYGEFFPLGAAIANDGQEVMFAADSGFGEHPSSTEVLNALHVGARHNREQRRAFAFVADVRGRRGDAVRVDLEHRNGTTLRLFVPYSRNRLTRRVKYGDMLSGPSDRRIWIDSSEQ